MNPAYRIPVGKFPLRDRFITQENAATISMQTFAIAVVAALVAAPAAAQEKPIKLKPGPGLDKVEANCQACHSLDYIQMNAHTGEGDHAVRRVETA